MKGSKMQGSQMKGSKMQSSKIGGNREITKSQMSYPMDENSEDPFPSAGESGNPYE